MLLVRPYHKGALKANSATLFCLVNAFHSSTLQTETTILSSSPLAPGPGGNFLLVSTRNPILYWPTSEHCNQFRKMRHKENLLGQKKSLFSTCPVPCCFDSSHVMLQLYDCGQSWGHRNQKNSRNIDQHPDIIELLRELPNLQISY